MAALEFDEQKIERLLELVDEISEARKESDKICSSSANIKQWVDRFLLSHPDEREYFTFMTHIDPDNAPRNANHGVQRILPVEEPEFEIDEREIEYVEIDENDQIVGNVSHEEVVEEVFICSKNLIAKLIEFTYIY